jgi:hypothetical protein
MSTIDGLSKHFEPVNGFKIAKAYLTNEEWAQVVAERDKWQEIANRWLALSNDQDLLCSLLKQERDQLRARLEISPDHDYDGIDSRDATIKELERQLQAQRFIKADAIMSAVEEYKREYCGQGIELLLTDYADRVRKGDE